MSVEKIETPRLSARWIEKIGFSLLSVLSFLLVLPIMAVIVYIIVRGAPAISWEFLSGMPSDGMKAGGILPAIIGTLYLTLGTAVFSVPLGIAAAIYLSEYAPENRLTRVIRIAIINLAGIPSIVYGLFGLGLFVIFLKLGTSILAASLTLSIMTLPVIITTTEEALRSVPYAFRVVSTSLGTSRWQTIRRVVLPQAVPGILTGVILGLERAAGETAPILFTGATFFLPQLAQLTVGCDHGVALSPVRDLDPGAGHADPDPVWHGAGAAGFRVEYEYHRDRHPIAGTRPQAVVSMDKIVIEHLSLRYSDGTESIKDLSMAIPANAVTALMGPSGGGKSTFLRVLNRLNDLADVVAQSGVVLIDGQDILDPETDVIALRRKVGMVFSRPLPLPLTIYQNVTYGLEVAGERSRIVLDKAVREALEQAELWDEVHDRLDDPAISALRRPTAAPVPGPCTGLETRDHPAG